MELGAHLVTTIGDKCRMCYTCVRECPAKAIRVTGGQAMVIHERCIGCGICVGVCSQNAKVVYDSVSEVANLLNKNKNVVAIIAPSFPAEFGDQTTAQVVSAIRSLGFKYVCEVAFGADLTSLKYKKLLTETKQKYIATTCPSVVSYVEKYHPELIENLAPIVSPMIAEARALRNFYGSDISIVFIGPCIAKKHEATKYNEQNEIDAVLTFKELNHILKENAVTPCKDVDDGFDPPYSGLGALYSISKGMLQSAEIKEDLLDGEVVAVDGKLEFVSSIKEFATGTMDVKLLEILCCKGCIMGPGTTADTPLCHRRDAVSRYVRDKQKNSDAELYIKDIEKCQNIDLTTGYSAQSTVSKMPDRDALSKIMSQMGKNSIEDELNCGACGYDTCLAHAGAIFNGLAENEMCLPFTIDRLKNSLSDLNIKNDQLESTREALRNSEKLASMGQLSAGIAHEINNPLGVILLYANLIMENVSENSSNHRDLQEVVKHAERCKKIVGDLLNFARKNKVIYSPTKILTLIQNCLNALTIPKRISIKTNFKMGDIFVEIDGDQIMQVIINLVNNAIEAIEGEGIIEIITEELADDFKIIIKDNGSGIKKELLKKIFEPLFTTKQMGKGTGLGLAVIYGIIKMHKGQIFVESNDDVTVGPKGSSFIVILPKNEINLKEKL